MKIGDATIAAFMMGSTAVQAVYLGSSLVWSAEPDPDAGIAAILSDGAHMALDTPKPQYLWTESTKVTQVAADGDLIGAALTRFGTTPYNFLQSTGGARPSWDDFGYVKFTGSPQQLQSTDGVDVLRNAAAAFLCVGVIPDATPNNSGVIVVGTPTANVTRNAIHLNSNGSISYFSKRLDLTALTTLTTAPGLVSVGIPAVISAQTIYNGTGAGSMKIWLNGVEVASGTVAGTAGNSQDTASNRFLIGRSATSTAGAGYFTGRIRRPVVARKAMTDSERAVIEAWVGGAVMTANGRDLGFGARSFFSGNASMALVVGDLVYLTVAKDNGLGSQIIEWNTVTNALRIAFQSGVVSGNDHADGCLTRTAAATYLYAVSPHVGAQLYIGRGATVSGIVETDIAASLGTSNLSYSNVFQMDDGTIIHFGRGGGTTPRPQRYTLSTDDGVTWSTYLPWIWDSVEGLSPYVQFAHGGDRVWTMSTDTHPDIFGVPYKNKIYMGYFKDEAVYDLNNVDLGALPVLPSAPTMVHDGSDTGDGNGAWCWDLKKHVDDLTGAYASFPTVDNHRYHRVRVIGGVPSTEVVVDDAGGSLYGPSPNDQPYYSGGIACHPTNPDIMFASISDPAVESGVHQLYRMERVSEGNWVRAQQLTFGSVPSFRPDTSTGVLTCVRGPYPGYEDFGGCHIMGWLI
jgi:hypothetical protein